MSKALKLKNNNYIDSTGIVHNRETLNNVLNKGIIKKQSIPVSMGPVQGWYPVGNANLTGYDNASLTFLVEQVFGTGSAILKLNIRCNGGNELELSEFSFTELSGGLKKDNFRLWLNGNNFYLYTNNDLNYGRINFTLLNEKTLNTNLSYGIWNFDSPNYNDNINEPDTLRPTISGPAIYKGVVTATIEKRYASNVSVTAYIPDGYNFVQWTHCATVGWVGSLYAATPDLVTTGIWNASTHDDTTEQGIIKAFYLCAKLPVNS